MNTEQKEKQVMQSTSVQDVSAILPWLPLIVACLAEMVWIVAPWGTMLSFICLMAIIPTIVLSLVVGIVMLIKREHPKRAVWILICTIFLMPFLTWLLLDVFHLHLLLHGV